MLSNFNLSQLFLFPIKDDDTRKNFLIAALVYFVSFVIPILPLILGIGYSARVMRQILNGEEPHMPAWDDWESMLKDGVYLFGVRLVYTLPLFAILFPFALAFMFMPVWMESNRAGSDQTLFLVFLVFGLFMLILLPVSLALGIILPAAEVHVVAHNDFAAGFRVREWWAIFRANWVGFLLAYLIAMLASMVLSTIVSIAMITIILFCVIPFIMPAITAYLTLVMYAAYAQAYKAGKDRLAANSQLLPTISQ